MAKITRRTEDQIRSDRKFITTLLRKGGLTCQEIAERINNRYAKNKIDISICDETVRLDIKAIRRELQKDFEDNIDALRQEAILKFNESKRLALEAYKKSFGDDIKETNREGGNEKIGAFQETITERVKLRGNPKFLDIALKADIEISKIQGLYQLSNEKSNDTSLSTLSDEELEKYLNDLDK